jgi:hypothetical protein
MTTLFIVGSPSHLKTLNKEQLLELTTELEVKAEVYSKEDWEAYNRVCEQLKNIDAILLDMYNKENEAFLTNQQT